MKSSGFKRPLYLSATISVIILALFYYWFAVAEREAVFLYYHDMGRRVPDTSPFSFVTGSRYWMSGLVASGFIFLIWFPLNFILHRLNRNYHQPIWWKTFLFACPVIVGGTLIITMTVNQPVLPFIFAIKLVVAALAGLALVLKASELVVEKFLKIILVAVAGCALAMLIVGISGILSNLDFLPAWRITLFIKIFAFCVGLLAIVVGIGVWRKIKFGTMELYIFSFAIAYPFGAVFHYLAGTDGHFYISNSDNFFMRNIPVQMIVWIVAYLFVYSIVKVASRLSSRIDKTPSEKRRSSDDFQL